MNRRGSFILRFGLLFALLLCARMTLLSNEFIQHCLIEAHTDSGRQLASINAHYDSAEEDQIFQSGKFVKPIEVSFSIAVPPELFPVFTYLFVIWEPPKVS